MTKQNLRFKWTSDCRQSFKELKALLNKSQIMVNIDVKHHTRLYVDYGPGGVAFTIAQKYTDKQGRDVYRLVHHNSRVLSDAESRYGKVEGESLAVLYGIRSNKMYL